MVRIRMRIVKDIRGDANQLGRYSHCMVGYNDRENICLAVCDSREEKNRGRQRPKKPLSCCQKIIPNADMKHME